MRSNYFLLGALLATAAAPAAALAQAAPAAGGGSPSLSEVVVTARRVNERLQDVPVAVTALSGSALEKRNVTKVEDLANVAPGLVITPANSPTTLIFTIRGLANANPNTGSDAAVGLYLNDVPINLQNGTNLGLFDLQNVQVLKGPQGTLFGRNTTGGAVLINANRPDFNGVHGYIQGGGNFYQVSNGYQARAVLNVPIGDKLAIRAGFDVVNQGGWVRNVMPRELPGQLVTFFPPPYGVTDFKNLNYVRSQAWRLSALWRPTDNIENLTVYDGGHEASTGLPANTRAVNPQGAVALFGPQFGWPDPVAAFQALQQTKQGYWWSSDIIGQMPLWLDTENVSNTTTINLNSHVTLKNIVGYRHVEETYAQDIVGLPGYYFVYREHTGGYNLSDELQLSGRTDGGFRWVGGLFFFKEDRQIVSDPLMQFGFPGASGDFRSNSTSYSVYAQGTEPLPFAPNISFTAGVRYTVDERHATDTRLQPTLGGAPTCVFPGLPATNCTLSGSKQFSRPTYTLSLDDKIDDKTLIYVASRRGYRSGGFSDTPGDAATFAPFQPETLTDYEVGLKRDWRLPGEGLLRTNVALYHDDYSDIQRLIVDPKNVTIQYIVNIPSAKVNGGEFELTFSPFRDLTFEYSYAMTFPKYGKFSTGVQDFTDKTFAYAPQHIHVAHVSYNLPIDRSFGTMSFSANYHYQTFEFYDDEVQTSGPNFPASILGQKAYGLLGLNANWTRIFGSNCDLEIFANNVLNAKAAPNGAPTYNSLGIGISFFSVPPRLVGFNLRYHFGE